MKWSRGDKIAAIALFVGIASLGAGFFTTAYQAEIKAWMQANHIGTRLGQYSLLVFWMALGYVIAISLRKIRNRTPRLLSPFDSNDVIAQLTHHPRITANYQQDILKIDVHALIRNFSDHDVPINSGRCAIRIGVRDFESLANIEKLTVPAREERPYTFTLTLRGNITRKVDEFFEGNVCAMSGSCAFQFSVGIPGIDTINIPAQLACIELAEVGGPRQREARQQIASAFSQDSIDRLRAYDRIRYKYTSDADLLAIVEHILRKDETAAVTATQQHTGLEINEARRFVENTRDHLIQMGNQPPS